MKRTPRSPRTAAQTIRADIRKIESARRELLESLDTGTNGTASSMSDPELLEVLATLRASGARLEALREQLAGAEAAEALLAA